MLIKEIFISGIGVFLEKNLKSFIFVNMYKSKYFIDI